MGQPTVQLSVTELVRVILERNPEATLLMVVDELHYARRTLINHLKKEGTTFSQIKADVQVSFSTGAAPITRSVQPKPTPSSNKVKKSTVKKGSSKKPLPPPITPPDPPANQAQTPVEDRSDLIPDDLMEDIEKINAIRQQLGGDVKLTEVVSFLKEMNALHPTQESKLKESLKNEPIDRLIGLILPNGYKFQKTVPTTFDQKELQSLYEESDL
jgi:hypothetical protein